jgi:hypothetical protein
MDESPSAFLKNAKGFVRNPLGIIGLLISLIYSVTVIVAGLSPRLTSDQRWVFVIFAALFPFPVLWVFFELVTKHHEKLYAPGDYRDERHFFGPQTAVDQQEREELEAQQLVAAGKDEVEPTPDDLTKKPGTLAFQQGGAPVPLEKNAAPPKTVSEARALIKEAEDRVFQDLEPKFPTPIYRNTNLVGRNQYIAFDGITGEPGRRVVGIEVKVLTHMKTFRTQLERVAQNASLAAENTGSLYSAAFELLLVLVTLGLPSDQVAAAVDLAHKRLSNIKNIKFNIITYDLAELRQV